MVKKVRRRKKGESNRWGLRISEKLITSLREKGYNLAQLVRMWVEEFDNLTNDPKVLDFKKDVEVRNIEK